MKADLFDLAPCPLVITDRQGVIRKANHAFARLIGWPTMSAPADCKFVTLLTPPSQYIFGAMVLPPLHLTGAVQEIELDVRGANNDIYSVLLSANQLHDPDWGDVHYFSMTMSKARRAYEREQLAARTQLEHKQEFLDLAEKLAHLGHWYIDLEKQDSFWSPEVYAVHGLERHADIPLTLDAALAFYHPEDVPGIRVLMEKAIAEKTPFAFKGRLAATPTLGERIVEVSGLVEVCPMGKPVGIFGVIRDVTEAARAQRDLETSEERYRLLADNVPGMIGYWDNQTLCRFANRAYLDWFGRPPEELIGCSMRAVLGEELFDLNKPYIDGVLAGTPQSFERAIVKPSGQTGYTWANYVPDIDAEGQIRGFYAVVTDVTALKEQNLADQASNALQSAVLSSTNYLVIATDPDGLVTVFNAAAEKALGYRAEEVIGKHTPLLWHDPEEVEARTEYFNRLLDKPIKPGLATLIARPPGNQGEPLEWRYISKDGSSFPVLVSGTRLHGLDGQITGYLGVCENITERRQAEQALRTSEATFRIAMEHASIGMTIQDGAGRWLRVNKAIAQLLGYSQEELLRESFRTVTHPDDLEESNRLMARLFTGEIENGTVEKRYVRKDGSIVWAQLSVAAVRYSNGSPQYIITQIQDITERREVERVKNEFISTVSHELRTPVTSIRGALGLLAGTMSHALPTEVQRLINIANANSERLLALVNDMLDIDRIASGRMHLDLSVHALDGLVSDAIEDMEPYAQRFGVHIVPPPVATGIRIAVDPRRFQQVMGNLLSNAAKFSPSGGQVRVAISQNKKHCRVSVQDQGPGISSSFVPHIFGKFSQADASATRLKSGSGLGLHISRGIIEQMNGTIGFDSAPGKGATFWIELPLQ